MKNFVTRMLSVILLLALAAFVQAGNFDWVDDLSVRAEADRNGFRASLQTRFRIGNAEINAVLGNVARPGDAYVVLRLGEISGRPVHDVIKHYKPGKGWGVMAKQLGIKPGSREFHALKRGHDLRFGHRAGPSGKSRGKPRSKGKGHGHV